MWGEEELATTSWPNERSRVSHNALKHRGFLTPSFALRSAAVRRSNDETKQRSERKRGKACFFEKLRAPHPAYGRKPVFAGVTL